MGNHISELFATRDYFEPNSFFCLLHNEIPSCTEFQMINNQENLLQNIISRYELSDEHILYRWENFNSKKQEVESTTSDYFLNLPDNFYLYFESGRVRLFYKKDCNTIVKKEYIKFLSDFIHNKSPEKKKFYMLVKDKRELLLQSFPVSNSEIDIENNYNEDLGLVHSKIQDFLTDEKRNGLVLLHGKPGTGKTNYLRHIISTTSQKIIFFPLQFMDQLSNPAFLPFITMHDRSILILEDCERLVEARNNNSDSGALANLLNLSDGLLGDALSLKVICTFNAGLGKIDPAILRKGRLVLRYEFKELEAEKANNLSQKLGHTNTYSEPVTLAEVYNPEENQKEKEERHFGFRITNQG